MAENKEQAAVIETDHCLVHRLRCLIDPAMMEEMRFTKKAAGEHRCQGQADNAADQHRDADGDRKFAEQSAHHAAEEKQGDEDGHQRKGHGDDGETDLLCPVEGGLHAVLAHLQVADDVFQHDDGVVDDKADRQGQGHQRHVVRGCSRADT